MLVANAIIPCPERSMTFTRRRTTFKNFNIFPR